MSNMTTDKLHVSTGRSSLKFYEPSEISRGLVLGSLLLLIGLLFVMMAWPSLSWKPIGYGYIAALLLIMVLHGYRFRLAKDSEALEITTCWLYFFPIRTATYQLSSVTQLQKLSGSNDVEYFYRLVFDDGRKYNIREQNGGHLAWALGISPVQAEKIEYDSN